MRDTEIIVDSFAGGGGASTGIEIALGRSPDIAINHDAVALAMHEVNHPQTVHLTADIWSVDPREATGGRPVGLLWASPDCKHFSKAKGGKPVSKNIRSLAWVVTHWANLVRPRVIILENVEEFRDWGPLGADDKPCPDRKGQTFARWVAQFEALGYRVEWKELRACDYGAPTIRKRLFLIARRDGRPIVWPAPTHGDPASEAVTAGRLKPWRTAAEIIDWSLPCPSIFDSSEEIFAEFGLRALRPLAPATMARIAKGVKRYVLDAPKPFIIPITHTRDSERGQAISDPLCTITSAHRGEQALVAPFVTGVGGRMAQTEPRGADQPAQTLTAKADSVVVTPFLTEFRGGHVGRSLEDPTATVTANSFVDRPGGAAPIGLVAPHLMTMRNADKPHQGADQPAHTVTAGGARATLVAARLSTYYGHGDGGDDRSASPAQPMRTQTTENRHAVVAAFLAQHNIDGRSREGNAGRSVDTPVSTVLQSGSHQGLVAANLLRQFGTGVGSSLHEPARTVMADGQGKTQLATAFLQKYYGADQDQQVEGPLHTATAKARFGLVTVEIEGEPYVISDIGMRMLTPRELFRAQGFPDSYVIDRMPDGRPITKTDQVSKCGNSVCPPIAAALVAANFRPDEAELAPEFMEAAE